MIGDRCLRVAHHAFILVLVVASAAVLSAQTVVDPRFVEFSPSADHNTNASDGTPLVQRYSLTVYVIGSSVAFDTMDLGKPTPSGGVIRVDFLPLLHSVPTPGVVFEARVTAIGPGGSTASSLSNGFSFQPACAPSLNSTGQSVGSGLATGSVGVTAGAGCTWSATSNAGWITLTGATGGTGNGSVPYSVSANTGAARTGTLTVAGLTYTVNQAALSCSYTVSPTSQAMPVGGGPALTDVTAPAGCAWTAVSNSTGWLTVTSGASGNGNGTVGFSTTANPNGTQRNGSITIAGQTFSVTQAAAPCTYTLTPPSQSVASTGGSGSTAVTAPNGCAWTGVSNNSGWLTVTSGASGSGSGSVGFSASANASSVPRTGTLTVGGQTFSVTQAGAPCTYSISPPSQSIAAGSATGSTNVTAPAGCTWSGVSNNTGWLTVTSGATGSGNGSVGFSASANPNTSQRSGTLTVAGQTFTVNQAALSCSYTVSPTSHSMAAGGGTSSTGVTATAGCAWTAVSSNTGWLTVTSGASGNGNGTVGFSTTANPNGTQRNGSITIAGQTFSVTQAAAPCTYTLTPPSQSVASTGGTGSTAVAAPTGCDWTGVSNNTGWLTVTSGAAGSGNGSVGFSASANASSVPRTGSLTVGGQTFNVTQAGAPCTYSISPPSQSIAAGTATGSTNVAAPAGCAWSGVSNNSGWLTVTSGATGSGNGSVGFSASANPNTSQRSGTLTVAGQTFTVTQAAAGCTFGISSNSLAVVAGGGSGSTNVTAGAGCAWSAASNDSWISVTSGASGSGNGPVGLSVAANPNASVRTGTLTIATQTFSVTQAAAPCTYTLTPPSQSVASTGGSGSTAVTAPNGCAWTGVSNNSGWLTVTSGASGSGSGSVGFSASANASSVPRTGSLTVGGQTFNVTQAGAPCTYSISPPSQSIAAGSATGSTSVTAPAGCTWSGVSNNTGWLTVTSGATGSGNGSVGFSASANPSTSQRSGTLTVAGETFTVTQAAAGCTFAISANSLSVVAAGGAGSTNVTAGAGCAWSAASNDGWITVTSGASGSGNGPVGFSVAANPNASARTGTLTIATRTFTVSQAASACSYSLTPTSRAVGSGGANTTTNVTTAPGCAWTAVSNTPAWLAITNGTSGSGNGSVSLSANTNTTTQVRVGTATIAGETFTVTQNAASCAFTVSPTTMQAPFAGANGSATVTTSDGCAWTAATNTSWITVTSGAEGTTSGQVNFTVAPSTATSQRLGSLTIAGRTFAVTQAGNTCSYVLTPANRTIGGEGGTGSITVGTSSGCPWTATTNQTWISVSGTGTASGSVSYTVSANATGTSRVGLISIGTQSFTITQGVPTGSAPVAPRGLRIVAVTGSE